MSFDYKTLYKNHCNQELLKVINQPEQYQPEAVAAAKEILAAREVSEEEEHEVTKELYNKQVEEELKAETVSAVSKYLREKVEFLVNPIKYKNEKFSPLYWLTILIIVQAVMYLTGIPHLIVTINRYLTIFSGYDDFGLFFKLYSVALLVFRIIYTPFLVYLLLKRNKWGWVLLFFSSLIGLLNSLNYQFFMYGNRDFYGLEYDLPVDLLYLLFRVLVMFFLLKGDVYTFFKLKTSQIKAIKLAALIIAVLFLIVQIPVYLNITL